MLRLLTTKRVICPAAVGHVAADVPAEETAAVGAVARYLFSFSAATTAPGRPFREWSRATEQTEMSNCRCGMGRFAQAVSAGKPRFWPPFPNNRSTPAPRNNEIMEGDATQLHQEHTHAAHTGCGRRATHSGWCPHRDISLCFPRTRVGILHQ